MHTLRWLMGVAFGGTCLASAALTIGPVRQSVWLEQRLDITVPIQLDAPTPADAVCASADVYFGDSLVDRSRVHVQPENTETPEGARLRITTTAAVNEPVVTVELQVGCAPRVLRRFVLLPDIPVRGEPPAQGGTPTPDLASVPLAPAAITGAALSDGTGAQRSATGPVQQPSTPAPAVRPHPKPRLHLSLQAPPPRTPPASRAGDRLTLAPLQPAEVPASPQATPPMAATPAVVASSPTDAERMLELQGHVLQLLQQSADNDAKMAALRARVEQAERERATLATVLAVAGTTAALAAAAVPLWLRRRRQRPEEDPALDPEAQELIVDFNPVDADRWNPAPRAVQ